MGAGFSLLPKGLPSEKNHPFLYVRKKTALKRLLYVEAKIKPRKLAKFLGGLDEPAPNPFASPQSLPFSVR